MSIIYNIFPKKKNDSNNELITKANLSYCIFILAVANVHPVLKTDC